LRGPRSPALCRARRPLYLPLAAQSMRNNGAIVT
jgi:hypothetical protein